MSKKSKLSYALLVPIISSVILSILLVNSTALIINEKGIKKLSLEYSQSLAQNYSHQIESQLAETLTIAETLSTNISTIMKKPDTQRSVVLSLVNSTLSNHEELVGIGVGFEPNAFDNKDAENIGQKHSDATGRFVPYTSQY